MPARLVAPILREFTGQVDIALQFVQIAKQLRNAATNRPLSPSHLEMIAELSFLRIVLAWDLYLEETFIRYLCGWSGVSGTPPTVLVPPIQKIEDARRALYGTKLYIFWSTPADILSRANNHFYLGEPYARPINAINAEIAEARIIRNRIAHRSKDAALKFKTLVKAKIGYNKQGVSPGRLLLTPISVGSTSSFLEYYGNTLVGAGNAIAS